MITTLDRVPERRPELLDFLRRHYPHAPLKGEPGFFAWRFDAHPLGGASDRYLIAIVDGRIVGQWPALPDRLRAGGTWRDVVWRIDLFVEPAARDRPIAAELFRAAMRLPVPTLATGAHEGLTPFYRALRWRTRSIIDTFYSVLRPSRLLELAGRPAPAWTRAADRVGPLLQRVDTRGAAARPLVDTAELGSIVEAVAPTLGVTGWRGPELLRWKTEGRPHGRGFGHVVPGRGYILSRVKARGRSTWIDVVDVVVGLDDGATLGALLGATRAEAVRRGADFVRLRLSRSEHTRFLKAPRWVRRARPAVDDVHMTGKGLDELAGPWHLTALCSDTVDAGGDDPD